MKVVFSAIFMSATLLASPAFADNGANGNGQGFENSLNFNACLNAGAGNGGEFGTVCGIIAVPHGELDPGQSQNNQAPEAGKCGELKC